MRVLVLAILAGLVLAGCEGAPGATVSATTAAALSTTLPVSLSPTDSPRSSPSLSPPPSPTPSNRPRPTPSVVPEETPRVPAARLDFFSDGRLDAALARCPTAAEVAWVDEHVKLTFKVDPTAPALVCTATGGSADLTHLQERAYQSILAIRRIQFEERLPWTDLTLWRWFDGEVKGITYRAGGSYCCDSPGVLTIQSDGDRASLQSDYWIDREEPQAFGLLYEVQLLVHEARHVAGYPHTCGESGDDLSLEEGGAWATVYWFATYLAEHTSPYLDPVDTDPDLYTTYARELAAYSLGRIGCT